MPFLVRTCCLLLIAFALTASSASAHKINVFAYAEAGLVRTESYFADGRPVRQSRVMVYDSSDTLLLEGKTDDDGLFSFAIPKVDDLTIVVREILGHRNTFLLRKAEIQAALPPDKGRD